MHYSSKLQKWGFDEKEIKRELLESQREYEAHTPFQKFCLDNYLTLNEHAVYCQCNNAALDDLAIGRLFGFKKIYLTAMVPGDISSHRYTITGIGCGSAGCRSLFTSSFFSKLEKGWAKAVAVAKKSRMVASALGKEDVKLGNKKSVWLCVR